MNKNRQDELIALARAGDDEALGQLCVWIRPKLIGIFVWRWQLPNHAEDLAQETLVCIVQGFRRGLAITDLLAFAFKHAKWIALDFLQAVKLEFGLSRNHVHSQYGHIRPLEIVPIEESHKIDSGIEDRAIARAIVYAALAANVAVPAKDAVVAFHFDGKSVPEYAREIHKSKITVSRLIRAGREQMRCAMTGAEYRLTSGGNIPRPLQVKKA